MDTARKRIIHFIENQGIKPSSFLEKTGLKKGFLDRSHENSGATDIFLSKILEEYPELSAQWLLTGKGEMISLLKEHDGRVDNDLLLKLLEEKNATIAALHKIIESQEELLSYYREQSNKPAEKSSRRAG